MNVGVYDVSQVSLGRDRGVFTILEVILQHLELASVLVSLDAFKGFSQFPLDVERHEIYSLLTHVGIFTSERIVQGSCSCIPSRDV